MGWFSVDGRKGVMLSDEALDDTFDFLRKLSQLYETEVGRKISCDELQTLLETSLRVNADDTLLSSFNEQKVVAVQIKTAKRPKRQTSKAGDIFVIPVDAKQFALGRVMQTGSGHGDLVEVFKATSSQPVPTPRILESGRLFHPVYLNGIRAFRDLAFQIIDSTPDYSPSDLDSLEFLVGVPGDYKARTGGKKSRPISDKEAATVERAVLWEPESLITRVRRTLAKSTN